jgi:leukotriene-A4 hydrolase
VTVDILAKIDADYNLTLTVDPECKQRWLPLAIRKGYNVALEPAHEFISVQGRLKYLNPIYLALIQSGQKELAVQWFNENIDFYHPLAITSLKKMLGLDEKEVSYFT